MPSRTTDDLKERILAEAFSVIEEKGVDQISFREIARRLGVSHQAPYKHFPSRDHILAAVIARCFESFSAHLQARRGSDQPFEDLGHMGLAYLEFAEAHPLRYRLMFNTRLPDVHAHPEMLAQAQYAFSLLQKRLENMDLADPHHDIAAPERHDALFIWSALHGMASLMQSDATATIGLNDQEKAIAIERMMRRLGVALKPDA